MLLKGSTYFEGFNLSGEMFDDILYLDFSKCFEMLEMCGIFNISGKNVFHCLGIWAFLVKMFEDDIFAILVFEHFL